MKGDVLGTRGFPDIQRGVEKHCENVYPLIAKKGVEVVPVSCPKNKTLEARKRIRLITEYAEEWAGLLPETKPAVLAG